MTEHQGSSFVNSCVKVPVDPYSRQPTPLYERPRIEIVQKQDKNRKINIVGRDSCRESVQDNAEERASSLENLVEFLDSIPDYGDINHLSNEQFKRKLDYLKRKQRILLKNLRNCLGPEEKPTNEGATSANESRDNHSAPTHEESNSRATDKRWNPAETELKLRGKKCSLGDSRTESPLLFPTGSFAGLAEDQDLLTYRCKDKATKTVRNREIHSAGKSWSTWSAESKSVDSVESDSENSAETRSLPPDSPKRWQPTVPKPFRFVIRDDAERYMSITEMEAEDRSLREREKNGIRGKKRRVRPIPLTSRIPLYDKLVAAKEERSRMIREESAWSLMSQVKPFRLECERRAEKAISRSSPELSAKNVPMTTRFKAKPVPKNLFGTEIYDRMLEDEYCRLLQKKMRAAELLKSASLPPSMARRERVKSAGFQPRHYAEKQHCRSIEALEMCTSPPPRIASSSERSRSAITDISTRGNNLAAILRCQASREKLEQEIRAKMEEEHRERMTKLRSSLIGRQPAWRALRQAARREHERDLDFRTCLRRDEAREQAERHRFEMEMMLNRVTRMPMLFERHSQNFHVAQDLESLAPAKYHCQLKKKKKKKKNNCINMSNQQLQQRKPKRINSSSLESDASPLSASQRDSGSLTSSSSPRPTASRSSKSSSSRKSGRSTVKSECSKKKNDRGPLRVSINETAELIEDTENDRYSSDRSRHDDRDDRVSAVSNENDSVEN